MDKKQVLTGNITGVYDMSGGTNEYNAAYVNNGDSSLTTNGSNLVNAEARYKNVYTKGSTDGYQENYEANSEKYGDAIYETSTQGVGTTSWYSDYSEHFPYADRGFFIRGGYNNQSTGAGIFYFGRGIGTPVNSYSFRIVVPVL